MRTTEAIHARLAAGDTTGVTRVHSAPDGPAGEIVTRGLFPPPSLAAAPRITLPSEDLVARLAQQHDLAEIADAVMLSFATGSEARIRATLAAHDNVSETLTDLVGQTRRLRQEKITDEFTGRATASLPLR